MRVVVRLARLLMAAIIVVGLVPADARAQAGRVHGRVIDSASGQPIRSATVVAESTTGLPGQFTAITDSKGRFAMLGLRSGMWVFSAKAEGYDLMAGTARITSLTQNPPVEFKLSKTPEPVISPVAALDVKSFQDELRSAQALLEASKADEAIAAYESLLTRLPTLTTLNYKLAEAYLLKGDARRALEFTEKVPEGDARYGWANPYLKLAQSASASGDVATAVRYLERAIAIDPDGPDAEKAKTMLGSLRRD